jgi:hypothetical protein
MEILLYLVCFPLTPSVLHLQCHLPQPFRFALGKAALTRAVDYGLRFSRSLPSFQLHRPVLF